jgi:hypothetical protein
VFSQKRGDVLPVEIVGDHRELVGLVGTGCCGVELNGRSRSESELTISSDSPQIRGRVQTYPLINSLTICEIQLSKEMLVLEL